MRKRAALRSCLFSATLVFGLLDGWSHPQTAMPENDGSEAAESIVQRPVTTLIEEFPDLAGLQPAASQEELPSVLTKLGENVALMFQNFSDTTSLEIVRQEKLQKNGKVGGWKETELHYLCLALNSPDTLELDEHRDHPTVTHPLSSGGPGHFMLTSGFVSAPLPFHPKNQSESIFRLLGRQRMEGRDALVLAFAQHPDARGLTCTFKANEGSVEARTQGLVWVDARNYQIIRMHTDLLRPVPKIRLARITTDIHFNEVRFNQLAAGEWLPRDVVVHVEWAGGVYRNFHRYSEFQLFTVQAKDAKLQP